MLHMFRNLISQSSTAGTIASIGAGVTGAAALTHHTTKNLPPDVQTIYWNNFLDPEACRSALREHELSRRKP